MSQGLDREHQRRLRAERVQTCLQLLWGDELPPGSSPHLTVLIDAVATDDAHGAQDLLVCQGDGLDVRTLAALWRHYLRTSPTQATASHSRPDPSPSACTGRAADADPAQATDEHQLLQLPAGLIQQMEHLGLLPQDLDPCPSESAITAPQDAKGHTSPGEASTATPTDVALETSAGAWVEECGAGAQDRVGVWQLDAASGIVTYDTLGAQLMGAGHHGQRGGHDTVHTHLQQLLHPADRDHVARLLEHSLRTGQDCRLHFRVLSATGSYTWLRSYARVLYTPDSGSPQLIGMVYLDRPGRFEGKDKDGHTAPGPTTPLTCT